MKNLIKTSCVTLALSVMFGVANADQLYYCQKTYNDGLGGMLNFVSASMTNTHQATCNYQYGFTVPVNDFYNNQFTDEYDAAVSSSGTWSMSPQDKFMGSCNSTDPKQCPFVYSPQ